jgi:prephenate dehydrogenase
VTRARLEGAQVAIVGLGLMGGSLAGALRGRCGSVVGVARRPETIETALARGLIDRGAADLADGVHQADAVILATPVRTILRQLAEIGPLLPAGCLLLDLGSTKVQVVAEMALLPEHVQPLGGHPMCGKEHSGIEAADPALYRGRTFFLTPLPRTSAEALTLGRELVQAAGANPLELEPERHDRLVAAVSHLPYLLAAALVATAGSATGADPAIERAIAGFFRDLSRPAGADVTVMADILLTNQAEIQRAVDEFQVQLRGLTRLAAPSSEAALRATLSGIRAQRMGLFP